MHAKIHIRRSQAWRGRSRICGRGRRMRRSQNITSSCKKSARLWKRILRHTMISQSREMSFRISESTFLFYRDGWHHNDPFFLPSENCGDKMPKTRTIYKCTEKSWRRLNANSTWPSTRLVTSLFLTKHPNSLHRSLQLASAQPLKWWPNTKSEACMGHSLNCLNVRRSMPLLLR